MKVRLKMEKPGFEKVTASGKKLYGPRKLLLCGFDSEAQLKFQQVIESAGLGSVPMVWVGTGQEGVRLFDLLEQPHGTGAGSPSALARAIIVCGIAEAELIGFMNICKQSGMRAPLWAVLTPVSEKWSIGQLIAELEREREKLKQPPQKSD